MLLIGSTIVQHFNLYMANLYDLLPHAEHLDQQDSDARKLSLVLSVAFRVTACIRPCSFTKPSGSVSWLVVVAADRRACRMVG